jgi:hypothetical protein
MEVPLLPRRVSDAVSVTRLTRSDQLFDQEAGIPLVEVIGEGLCHTEPPAIRVNLDIEDRRKV